MFHEIGLPEPPDAKAMLIRNTKSLSEVECSAANLNEASPRDDL